MAAGRHGGYRDNEFNDHESELKVSGLEYDYSKEEHKVNITGSRKVRIRDIRDTIRVRQNDIQEGEAMNGDYHSYPSRSDSGYPAVPKRCDYSATGTDREPGELSSESGSDNAIETESEVNDIEVMKIENGPLSPLKKKRKFSPIVWDNKNKPLGRDSRNTSQLLDLPLPPPPPLPKLFRQSINLVPEGGVKVSPIKDDNIQNLEALPVKILVPAEPVGNTLSDVPLDLSSTAHLGGHCGSDQELERLEDEDFVPIRCISSSRWADEAKSPHDEGEISEDGEMHKRRKILPSSKDDLGEPKREGNKEVKVQSSDSDERGTRCRSSSTSGNNDLVNIDMEYEYNHASSSQSDTDSEGGNIPRKTLESEIPPRRSINMLQGCRSVDEFERLNKIDEGTYGIVYRAKDNKTGEIVALKKVKMEKEREGFPLTSLREINILLSFHHQSIVDVKEVVVGSNLDSVFMVMEYMEHDLKALMETMKQPFSQSEVKCLMLQLLEGTKYLHDNWVLHRDLKTSNLLLNNRGELKICDFGLSRQYGSPLKPYTQLVVTLWYRSPELLLGAKQYSTAIDMWSLGCIMAELLSKQPLFNGKTEVDQLDKIFKTLGTPNEIIWPGFTKLPGVKVNFVKHQYNLLRKKFPATSFTGSPVLSESGFDLLNKLLTYDPEKRITAEAALNHPWFREVPLPKSKDFMPTFPAHHAQDRRTQRIMKSPDPLEEQRRKELRQRELGTGGLFQFG